MKAPFLYYLGYGVTALLLWLLPFFWAGWTKRSIPFLPRALSFQHSAAALFTDRSTVWWDHHLEVQAADDVRHELEERAVFGMGAFGYRTRYDRILNESSRNRLAGPIRQRLAEHVVRKVLTGSQPADGGTAYPGARALRIVRSLWRAGSHELSQPPDRWNPPPVTELTGTHRYVLGTYKLADGKVLEVRRKPPPATPNTAASAPASTSAPQTAPAARATPPTVPAAASRPSSLAPVKPQPPGGNGQIPSSAR